MNKTLKLTIALALPAAFLLVLAVLSLRSVSTSTAANQLGRIELQNNATPAYIDGNLKIGTTDHYTIHVEAGQALLASLVSPVRDVILSIQGADGQTLWGKTSLTFFGVLPTTQDYFISVTAMRSDSTYRLSLQLAPHVEDRTATSLQPILDSAPVSIDGHMSPGQMDSFTFEAVSGQVIYVDVWNSFPGQKIQPQVMDIVIDNAAGEALYGSSTFWMGELPASQKYSVNLIPSTWPEGAEQLDYTLSLSLNAPSEAHEPTRIQFPASQSLATVTDKITSMGKRLGKNRYLVNAIAGQKLNLKLTSENKDAFTASVRGKDGKLLAADYMFLTGYSDSPPNDYTIELPASQDYTISIIGNEGSSYTIQVIVLP